MKHFIAILTLLLLVVSGLYYNSTQNVIKRTKTAWYVGCTSGVSSATGAPIAAIIEFCNYGYKMQDWDQMSLIIEQNQDKFLEEHSESN